MAAGAIIGAGLAGVNAIVSAQRAKQARKEAERQHKEIMSSDIWDSSKAAIEGAKGINLTALHENMLRAVRENTAAGLEAMRSQGARGMARTGELIDNQNDAIRKAEADAAARLQPAQMALANQQMDNKRRKQGYLQGVEAGANQMAGEAHTQTMQSVADMGKNLVVGLNGIGGDGTTDGVTDTATPTTTPEFSVDGGGIMADPFIMNADPNSSLFATPQVQQQPMVNMPPMNVTGQYDQYGNIQTPPPAPLNFDLLNNSYLFK